MPPNNSRTPGSPLKEPETARVSSTFLSSFFSFWYLFLFSPSRKDPTQKSSWSLPGDQCLGSFKLGAWHRKATGTRDKVWKWLSSDGPWRSCRSAVWRGSIIESLLLCEKAWDCAVFKQTAAKRNTKLKKKKKEKGKREIREWKITVISNLKMYYYYYNYYYYYCGDRTG